MTKSLRPILAAFCVTVVSAVAEQPKPSPQSPAEMMRELRLQWLTRKPSTENAAQKDAVAAVLMDWPLDEQTVTILASAEGDASIYTTATFGVIGGIGHDPAKKAAQSFVECARKHLNLTTPTTDFSYAERKHVRFLIVTNSGVRSVSFTESEIRKPDTAARDLYAHGQAVLTAMREVAQKQQRGN